MKWIISTLLIGVHALGVYLYQEKPLEQSIADGAEIYQDFCLQCHGSKGEGVAGAFPPLAQSDYLKNELEASIRGIKYGMKGPITVNGVTYDGVMANQGLEAEEIADVMNYVLNNWGNKSSKQITPQEVVAIKKTK